jgi:inorganic triphosphatase YgiF
MRAIVARGSSMAHEVELKFDVEPGGIELARAAPMLDRAPSSEKLLESVYFDTKEGALREGGFSLRVRRSGDRFVQTVKRKRGRSAGLFVRQEWDSEVPRFALDGQALRKTPLKALLETLSEGALVPLIRGRFRRTAWIIDRKGSRIEIVLDEGEVRNGKARAPIRELELELQSGKPRMLFELAGELARAVPLRLGVLSKGERGYAIGKQRVGGPARAEPIALDPALSEGEAFRAVAHACLRQYRLNEIVLLAERDPGSLHQARIALRRLRSALSLFRTTVSGKEYQALREEIGWLASQLGDARDADVLIAGESGLAEDEILHARLLRTRGKAYDRVEAALGSERTRALMLRLALWIELGSWRFRERSGRPVGDLAAHQLERQWRKVRRNRGRIAEARGPERHQLRLDVKKLRYSAEFLAGLYSRRPKGVRRDRFLEALKDLQDRLGDLNDAEAAEKIAARLTPGARGSADRIRRRAMAEEAVAAADEAFNRAFASAGYWL